MKGDKLDKKVNIDGISATGKIATAAGLALVSAFANSAPITLSTSYALP